MRTIAIVTSAVLLALATTRAQTPWRTYGPGIESCGSWTNNRASPNNVVSVARSTAQLSWALGFVTGAGFAASRPLRLIDNAAVLGSLDNYCLQNPAKDIEAAAVALVRDLANVP